jgi:23S rRNA (cytosine1962-C5)-methyltransferase
MPSPVCCNCEWGGDFAAKAHKLLKAATSCTNFAFSRGGIFRSGILLQVNLCFGVRVLPCVIFEDEHLLVVNKPPGWNTHAPSPYAGEGIYDWLRHREPGWAKLAIIHRLDKETSGVMVFSKTSVANRSLTQQFTKREVRKKYLLLTDRPPPKKNLTIKSCLVRVGEKYVIRPLHSGGDVAETRFVIRARKNEPLYVGCYEVEAEPLTGRTHQIRVHAAEAGFPILGDELYGGTPAVRVYLHAAELTLKHPASGTLETFHAAVDAESDARVTLRTALIEPELTNAYRLIHGASDGWATLYVDRLGDYLLAQSESALTKEQSAELERHIARLGARGTYHKTLARQTRKMPMADASPRLVAGEAAPERFVIRENELQFELSFAEGYSVGLFLDQRDNRRRLMTGHLATEFELPWVGRASPRADEFAKGEMLRRLARTLAPPTSGGAPPLEVLNTFAYTCGFSVCAAKAGARTTNLDLSRKYLEWGKRNFELNRVNSAEHDFIYGDVFDWLRRLAKKQRTFDVILLDPPTFSQSKESGIFRAEKDYGKLIAQALPLLKQSGVLFASTNAADWAAEDFLETVEGAIRTSKRRILQRQYFPQPPDFPLSRQEQGYLKTVWLRIE